MTDLVPRLLEAIAAKEAKARGASPSPWTLRRDSLGDDHWADISAADGSSPVDTESGAIGPDLATAEFIADNDPSSILRRCAADRDIVEWCTEMVGDLDMGRYGEPGLLKGHPQSLAVTLAAETLLNLARGYGLDVTG